MVQYYEVQIGNLHFPIFIQKDWGEHQKFIIIDSVS